MVQTTIRLPEKLYEKLKQEAKKRGMSLNAYLISVLYSLFMCGNQIDQCFHPNTPILKILQFFFFHLLFHLLSAILQTSSDLQRVAKEYERHSKKQ